MKFVKNVFDGTIGKVIDLAKDPLKQWQERKTIKTTARMEVEKLKAKAKVAAAERNYELAKDGKATERSWDEKAFDDAERTWKDEAQFVVVITPVALCFVCPERVLAGFEAIQRLPWWWIVAFLGILARNFSLRWLVAPIAGLFGGGKK